MLSNLEELLDEYPSNDENVELQIMDICEKARKQLKIQSFNDPSYKVLHQQQFMYFSFLPSHIYAKICHKCAAKCVEKLHLWTLCSEIYQELLLHESFSYQRGHWYSRLALILDFHLKQYSLSFNVCESALVDNYVARDVRNEILKRYLKLSNKLSLKHSILYPNNSVFDFDIHSQNSDCYLDENGIIDIHKLPHIIIKGEIPFNHNPGQRSIFFNSNNDMCSVEQLIIEYFSKEENGNWKMGVHCESRLYQMLFSIFMFDIIFCDSHIPGVFQHAWQSQPLDFQTPWFYLSRKQMIHDRIQVIEHMSEKEMGACINSFYSKHDGQSIVGVSWNWISSFDINIDQKEITDICHCIGSHALAMICLRLSRNYSYFCSGIPDLLLWDINQRKCKIVEVKSARDRLSAKQISWIVFLKTVANIDVLVAFLE